MRIGRGNRSTRTKPASVPHFPLQIPHDLGSNLGCRGEKLAANGLSYGTARTLLNLINVTQQVCNLGNQNFRNLNSTMCGKEWCMINVQQAEIGNNVQSGRLWTETPQSLQYITLNSYFKWKKSKHKYRWVELYCAYRTEMIQFCTLYHRLMHVLRLSSILLKNLQNVDDICDTRVPYTVKTMADFNSRR
jgi:hypothetical protein